MSLSSKNDLLRREFTRARLKWEGNTPELSGKFIISEMGQLVCEDKTLVEI